MKSLSESMKEFKTNEAKKHEEANTDSAIKALIDAKPSDDNAEQGKFVSLMKGLAFSDDPKATAFMKKLMGEIDTSFSGDKLEEENIMKACAGLCADSTDEEIKAVADKSGYDEKAIKKIVASKEKMSEGVSGAEIEAIMKKAHTAEILDMMSDAESDKAISKKLSKYSEEISGM